MSCAELLRQSALTIIGAGIGCDYQHDEPRSVSFDAKLRSFAHRWKARARQGMRRWMGG